MIILWFSVFAAASVALYFFSYRIAAEKIESLQLVEELKTKAIVIEQSERLATMYIGLTFIYVTFVFLYVLVYSNRLTGPIFKLGKVLDESIQNQSWPSEIRFRKNDAFKDIAEKFNAFVKLMKAKK